ncbi:MAG: hypothetical protein Q8P40_04465, partial [Nitrospirota bacterium]|nr:hypothetical protein [Nitrospirota bacterium]
MNKFEKLIRENNTLRVLLIAVVRLIIGMPIWYLHTLIKIEPFAILVKALAETILIAGFVGIIYEIIQKRRFEEEMKHAVSQAMTDAGVIKKFSDEAVDSIIKNCLEAKL